MNGLACVAATIIALSLAMMIFARVRAGCAHRHLRAEFPKVDASLFPKGWWRKK